MVLAFFWSLFFLWYTIKLTSYKEEDMFDSLFVSLFWAIFFSRLVYVLFNISTFGLNPLKFILINGYPGLSMWGALGGGFLSFYLYCRAKKIEFLKAIDYFIPALFTALVFLKIGSFFAGIDVGTKTSFLLSVKYAGYSGARHLVALYEAVIFGIGAYISYTIMLLIRREKLKHGFVWYFFLLFFSLDNLLLDNLKQNHLYFARIDVSVAISAVLTVFFTAYFIRYFRVEIRKYIVTILHKTTTHGKKIKRTISHHIKKNSRKSSDIADKKD